MATHYHALFGQLEGTRISKQGIAAIQKALPKAKVEFTDVQDPPELEEEPQGEEPHDD